MSVSSIVEEYNIYASVTICQKLIYPLSFSRLLPATVMKLNYSLENDENAVFGVCHLVLVRVSYELPVTAT